VLILNAAGTGYPFACLEGSIISASRTAASAVSAADRLTRDRRRPRRLGFVGAGLISRYVHTFLARTGWTFDEIGVHDLSGEAAGRFRDELARSGTADRVTRYDGPEGLVRSSDLVVFATVAARPHVHDVGWFDHHPLVLHVSLRDLAPEIVVASTNVVDDVDHCLRAETSVHLAERLTGTRDFVHGTLPALLRGEQEVPTGSRPLVFSPFGLGVLDVAVGKFVYDEVARSGLLRSVDDFFHELSRHGG
jgi:ornithine cyclodeaminase